MSRTRHRRPNRRERAALVCFSGHYACFMITERWLYDNGPNRYHKGMRRRTVIEPSPAEQKSRVARWKARHAIQAQESADAP